MPTLQYELLNQERKMQETKKKVAAYCRVSTDNEDQAKLLKANSDISASISSVIPIGSFMPYLPMRAFLERTRKSEKNLTA